MKMKYKLGILLLILWTNGIAAHRFLDHIPFFIFQSLWRFVLMVGPNMSLGTNVSGFLLPKPLG